MRRSRLIIAMAIGATVSAAALQPVWSADETPAVPGDLGQSLVDECVGESDLALEEVGDLILPGGRSCLSGGPPNDCDDYPVPYGGSCSCTSSLTQEQCRVCDTGEQGLVLETTCTICGVCYSPPCEINPCTQRTSRTCST